MVIEFSRKSLSKKITVSIIAITLVGAIFMIMFRDLRELIYFLLSLLTLISILFYSYKIRNYPNTIVLEQDSIHIDYLNKGFFKMKNYSGKIHELTIITNGKNDLIIKKDEFVVALIKRSSIKRKDRKALLDTIGTPHQPENSLSSSPQ